MSAPDTLTLKSKQTGQPQRSASPWLNALLTGQEQLPASPLAWLNALRAEALERASVLTVPTTRDEAWRFTDIFRLTK